MVYFRQKPNLKWMIMGVPLWLRKPRCILHKCFNDCLKDTPELPLQQERLSRTWRGASVARARIRGSHQHPQAMLRACFCSCKVARSRLGWRVMINNYWHHDKQGSCEMFCELLYVIAHCQHTLLDMQACWVPGFWMFLVFWMQQYMNS